MTTQEVLAPFVEEGKSMTKYDVELRFAKVAIFRIADAINSAVKAGFLARHITSSGRVHYKLTSAGSEAYKLYQSAQ